MKPRVVTLPAIKDPIHDSPGFAKKLLADADTPRGVGAHVEIMGLCGFGCLYCSSNTGNFLRINRERFADETAKQLGERLYPSTAPDLTFAWPDVEANLDRQLAGKPATWGEGRMLVASQLTDLFSPFQVANGTTERVLRNLVERTRFKIRVLTKNAAVARPPFLGLLSEHRDRFLVGLSIGTLDDAWAKKIEVGTSPPSARVRAMRALQDAGIETYGMLCPVFPDAVFAKEHGRKIEDLLDAIGAKNCAHVFFEALNDRGNWRLIANGYDEGSEGRKWIERVWGEGDRAAWSSYAAELHTRVVAKARTEGWEPRHLIYEGMITARDAPAFGDLYGVLLQSPPFDDPKDEKHPLNGYSTNPHIRALQKSPEHGRAEGWRAARRAAGLKACGPAPAPKRRLDVVQPAQPFHGQLGLDLGGM